VFVLSPDGALFAVNTDHMSVYKFRRSPPLDLVIPAPTARSPCGLRTSSTSGKRRRSRQMCHQSDAFRPSATTSSPSRVGSGESSPPSNVDRRDTPSAPSVSGHCADEFVVPAIIIRLPVVDGRPLQKPDNFRPAEPSQIMSEDDVIRCSDTNTSKGKAILSCICGTQRLSAVRGCNPHELRPSAPGCKYLINGYTLYRACNIFLMMCDQRPSRNMKFTVAQCAVGIAQ